MNSPNKESAPVLALIQDIKDGRVDPSTINKEMRQLCVEMFMSEGYPRAHMAQILKRSEKTIKRDIDDIYLRNSMNPDLNLLKQIVGKLTMSAEIHRNHLMRLARVKGSSVSEKAQAEYFAFKILTETVRCMQSLGYLPSQPQAVVGDISLHVNQGDEKSFDELRGELIDIEKISRESGSISDELKKEVLQISQQIEKAEITQKIRKIQENSEENTNDKEN